MYDAYMNSTDGDIDGRIGARVRALRIARKLTLDGLAGHAAVSRAMLSRIERGESSPTAQLLGKICGGLGVTFSVLFAETEVTADRKSTRLHSSPYCTSRMPSSARNKKINLV